MADPNAQNAMQSINWFFQIAGLALDSVQTSGDVLTKALQPLENDPYIAQLNQMIKNGECNARIITKATGESKEDYESRIDEMKKNFADKGMFCHVARKGDNYIFITLKEEEAMANQVLGSEKKDKNYTNSELKTYSGNNVKEFKTDNVYAAYMFKKRCEANGVPVKVEAVSKMGSPDMIYKIRFAEKDLNIMNAIKRNVAIDITDQANSLRKSQIDFEMNKNLSNINQTLNLENEGMVIVGQNGTALRVSTTGVTIIKDENSEIVYKGSYPEAHQAFRNKILGELGKMGNTTALTAEQYEHYKLAENKKDFLVDVERQQGRPVMTEQEKEIYKKAEQNRAKVEAKLNQYHPEEVRVDLNDYNNEEALSAFKANEKIDYEASHDISESEQSDAVFLDDARAFNEGLIPEDLEISLDVDEIAENMMDTDVIDVNEQLDREAEAGQEI